MVCLGWTRAASDFIKVLCALNLVFMLCWLHTQGCIRLVRQRAENCNKHHDNVTADLKAVRLAD